MAQQRRSARRGKSTASIHAASAYRVIQQTDGVKDQIFQGPLERGWSYEKRLTRQNGSWVVAELHVFPAPAAEQPGESETSPHVPRLPLSGITARLLRKIPFSEPPLQGLRELDALFYRVAQTLRGLREERAKLKRKLRRGARQLNDTQDQWLRDLELAEVAQLYVNARAVSRRPNVEISNRLGMPEWKVRDKVHQARTRGLISADQMKKQGKAKGELTVRARKLLDNAPAIRSGEELKGVVAAHYPKFRHLAHRVLKNRGRDEGSC